MFTLLLIASVFASQFKKVGPLRSGKTTAQWKDRIIYQVLTDRFRRSDGANSSCNLGDYCGGTYKGLVDKLDYIKNLGMDAIWISPIVENTWGAYHGYHAKNFYALNTNFGSEEEFRTFVSECHKRDIWVMVDVVYNHVGPVGTDYGQINPFNQYYHYHDRCDITDYSDQGNVEYCRVADLPDLNQDNDYVKNELIAWTHWLIDNYDIDGLRIDTVKHVNPSFWRALIADFPNTYFVGEVFDGSVPYMKTYTDIFPQLSYPMYYTLLNVFAYHQSAYQIRNRLEEYSNYGIDNTVLGGFIDNHDNKRWLNINGDWTMMKNAMAFNLLSSAIPIVYYGTEQGYAGGDDPNNREPLWSSGYNENHELYKFIKTAAAARKLIGTNDPHIERYCDDNFYAFSRGNVLVCLANTNSISRQITYLPYTAGTQLHELYSNTYQTVGNNGLPITINNGQPQIWIPA